MKIARLYNQHAYCREWKGEDLMVYDNSLSHGCMWLRDGDKTIAVLILNGHSLVIEEETEEP